MDHFAHEWYNKVADALHTNVCSQKRLQALERIRRELLTDTNVSERDRDLLVDNIVSFINEEKEEIDKQNLKGLDYILKLRLDLQDVHCEYITNTRVLNTQDDIRWKYLSPKILRIDKYKFKDAIEYALLQGVNKVDMQQLLKKDFLDPYLSFYKDLSYEVEELDVQWGVPQTPVWQFASLRIVVFLEEIFSVIEEFLPQQKSSYECLETEEVNKWVMKQKLFFSIEEILFNRGYIIIEEKRYKWNKSLKGNTYRKLFDLSKVLIETHGVFRPIIDGKKKKDWHYRQFISNRYGLPKDCLAKTYKDHKPTLKIAEGSFKWLDGALRES